jgi:hypothetical protein
MALILERGSASAINLRNASEIEQGVIWGISFATVLQRWTFRDDLVPTFALDILPRHF